MEIGTEGNEANEETRSRLLRLLRYLLFRCFNLNFSSLARQVSVVRFYWFISVHYKWKLKCEECQAERSTFGSL
jgi:hypothetical protein